MSVWITPLSSPSTPPFEGKYIFIKWGVRDIHLTCVCEWELLSLTPSCRIKGTKKGKVFCVAWNEDILQKRIPNVMMQSHLTHKKGVLKLGSVSRQLNSTSCISIPLVLHMSWCVQSTSWIRGCLPFALSWNLHINANVLNSIRFNAWELVLSRCFFQYRQLFCSLQNKRKLFTDFSSESLRAQE